MVADCGGPACIVTRDCGFKISVSNRRQMVADLADAILAIDRHREIILQKGTAAMDRIATAFAEENYRQAVNAIYRSVSERGAD